MIVSLDTYYELVWLFACHGPDISSQRIFDQEIYQALSENQPEVLDKIVQQSQHPERDVCRYC